MRRPFYIRRFRDRGRGGPRNFPNSRQKIGSSRLAYSLSLGKVNRT